MPIRFVPITWFQQVSSWDQRTLELCHCANDLKLHAFGVDDDSKSECSSKPHSWYGSFQANATGLLLPSAEAQRFYEFFMSRFIVGIYFQTKAQSFLTVWLSRNPGLSLRA